MVQIMRHLVYMEGASEPPTWQPLARIKIMQTHRFTNGSGAAHKVCIAGYSGHFSVWFDAAGKLTDVERFQDNGRVVSVSERLTGIRADLERAVAHLVN